MITLNSSLLISRRIRHKEENAGQGGSEDIITKNYLVGGNFSCTSIDTFLNVL